MKKVFLTACAATFILLSACHKDDNNNNDNLNSTDQNFMTQVSMGNRAEIMAGQLASTKGNSASVRSYGQFMVSEHTTAQNDLQNLSTSSGYQLSNSISHDDSMLMTRLNSLSGRAFDTTYINSQLYDHQKTLSVFQTEISSGNRQEVKSYANTYLPHIQQHYNRADSIRRSL